MNIDIDPISNLPSHSYDYVNKIGANPIALAVLAVIIIVYYIVFSSLPSSQVVESSSQHIPTLGFFEILLWGVFIALLFLNAITYFYELDLDVSLHKLFSKKPELDIEVSGPAESTIVPEIKMAKQVFHIPNNTLTYKDAEALCKAYGAELATYDQVENSYQKGGEWCSYGWSKNQLALFPTQKATYKKLQKIKGHEHDCGRPGINGGYIGNPNVKYGANCYGYKPEITQQEQRDMATNQIYPKSKEEQDFENRVDKWKHKLSQVEVAPFNKKTWSRI